MCHTELRPIYLHAERVKIGKRARRNVYQLWSNHGEKRHLVKPFKNWKTATKEIMEAAGLEKQFEHIRDRGAE